MKAVRTAIVALGTTVVGMTAAVSAHAAPAPRAATCSGGQISSGTYTQLTVTGACTVAEGATVVVRGNLTVAPGAMFDAQTHSTVTVQGNVLAGRGSMFALGCTPAHPCNGDETETAPTHDTVRGNVVLDHVFDAALNGDTIGGNLVVNGGGPGYSLDPWIPFSMKDDVVHGSVLVSNLRTSWWGLIRSTVGGNVVVTNVRGADPDSTEIVANTIGGNLICLGNSPAPHLGDAVEGAPPGYGPNTVHGHAIGQCASIPA
jgi:hypothetical protein